MKRNTTVVIQGLYSCNFYIYIVGPCWSQIYLENANDGMMFSGLIWLCMQVTGNNEKAREILVEALEHVQPSKPLLEVIYLVF